MEQAISYNYDVFISYSHRDKDWVHGDLLTKLESQGLKTCIDYRDFEPGAPNVTEMRRAVTTSRKTLLILTREYLQSGWTQFEALMAQTLDPANRGRRVIPLRKDVCDLPDEIGYLAFVDFADPVNWDIEWKKLLTALAPPPQAKVAPAAPPRVFDVQKADETSRSAREGLEALIKLMDNRQVQDDVAIFEAIFETSCTQIDSLARYKDLHDLLHTLQFRCYNYLNAVLQNARKTPNDPGLWDNVFEYESTIQDLMVGVRKYTEDESLRTLAPWTQSLADSLRNLFKATNTCDAQQITGCLRPISQILYVQPVLINTRLNEAARALPLPGLVKALTGIHQKLDQGQVDLTTVRKFREGVNALSKLHGDLTLLIQEHDRWQQIDIELRRIDATIAHDAMELQLSWDDLKARTSTPVEKMDEWSELLVSDVTKLDEALAANDLNRTKFYFGRYRGRIANHFYQVDASLKELCSNLRRVGEPLAAILEIM